MNAKLLSGVFPIHSSACCAYAWLHPVRTFSPKVRTFSSQKHIDKIPHIFKKLHTHGLHTDFFILNFGKWGPWFQSYLSNRKQFVTIRDSSSTPAPVNQGMPQGSVLGLLLFVVAQWLALLEFVCSPCVYMGFLQVLQFLPCQKTSMLG